MWNSYNSPSFATNPSTLWPSNAQGNSRSALNKWLEQESFKLIAIQLIEHVSPENYAGILNNFDKLLEVLKEYLIMISCEVNTNPNNGWKYSSINNYDTCRSLIDNILKKLPGSEGEKNYFK